MVALPPPTCEKNTVSWPPGPTRSISKSCSAEWVRPFNVSVTRVRLPARPETEIVDGYTAATLVSGSEMELPLL